MILDRDDSEILTTAFSCQIRKAGRIKEKLRGKSLVLFPSFGKSSPV